MRDHLHGPLKTVLGWVGRGHFPGTVASHTEWAAVWAFRQRCRGWLSGGPGDGGRALVPCGYEVKGRGGADRSLEVSEEATGRLIQAMDGSSLGWRSCGYGQKGTMSGCGGGWPW